MVAESRPGVQVVFLLRLLAGTGLIWRPTERSLLAAAGWLMLVVAIYVFNGITDMQGDAINGSRRPIASSRLSCATARRWCIALSCGGLAVCGWVSQLELSLAVVMLAIGWAYSAGPSLKSAPLGLGLVVGAGAALTYAAGWIAQDGSDQRSFALMLALSGWVGLCCVTKDFSDVEGDRVAGRRTWPVLLGPVRAARIVAATALAGGAVLAIAAVRFGSWTLALPLALGSVVLAVEVLVSAGAADRTIRRRPYRAFMATQYAANLALICSGAG